MLLRVGFGSAIFCLVLLQVHVKFEVTYFWINFVYYMLLFLHQGWISASSRMGIEFWIAYRRLHIKDLFSCLLFFFFRQEHRCWAFVCSHNVHSFIKFRLFFFFLNLIHVIFDQFKRINIRRRRTLIAWKNCEVTVLYNVTMQTIERNDRKNRYSEQVLCIHTTKLKTLRSNNKQTNKKPNNSKKTVHRVRNASE